MLSARHAELNYFSRCLDRLSESRSTGVLLSGEAGIGKTAVLSAVAKKATARGFLACRVYLGDYGPASPFELWRRGMSEWIEQAYRMGRQDAVRSLMSESWDVLSGLTPDLFARYGRAPRCDHSRRADPRIDDVTRRLAEEINAFFKKTSELLPYVFLVDNLHSADSDSLALIPRLSPLANEQAIMFVASFRPEHIQPGSTASRVIGDLQSCGLLHTVNLGPLSEAGVREYLLDRGESDSHEKVSALHSMTGGHPLLLEQLLPLLPQAQEAQEQTALEHAMVSDNTRAVLHDIMVYRLARLSTCDRRIIEAAAVLGEDLEENALIHCADCTPEEASRALKSAQSLGMLAINGETDTRYRYRFRHWLVQDSIAATIDPKTARNLHVRAANFLYRSVRDTDVARLRRIAGHYFVGGGDKCRRRGIQCMLSAGRGGLRLGAWREAGAVLNELEQRHRMDMGDSEHVELDLMLGIIAVYDDRKAEAYDRVRLAIGRLVNGTAMGNALELVLRPEIEDLCDSDIGSLLEDLLPAIAEAHWMNQSAAIDLSAASYRSKEGTNAHRSHSEYMDDHTVLVKRFEQLAEKKGRTSIARHSSELRDRLTFDKPSDWSNSDIDDEVRARHAIDEAYRFLFREAYNPITQRAYAAEALQLAEETGNAFLIAEAYQILFRLAYRALNTAEARRLSSAGLEVYPVHDPLLNGRAQVEALCGNFEEALAYVTHLRRNVGTGEGPSVSHIGLGGALHSVAVLFGGVTELLTEADEVLSRLLSRSNIAPIVRAQAITLQIAGRCYLDRLDDPAAAYTQVQDLDSGPLLPRGSIERVLMMVAAANGWEQRVREHLKVAREWYEHHGDHGTRILTMAEGAGLLSGGTRIAGTRLSPGMGTYRKACALFAEARTQAAEHGLPSVPGLMSPPRNRSRALPLSYWPTETLPFAFQTREAD